MRFEGRLPRDDVNVSRTSVLGEAATLVTGIATVVLLLALAVYASVELVVRFLPADVEARWFGGLAVGPDTGDVRLAPTQALVDRLAAHWEGNPYVFRVGVMRAEAPNALALPGGGILVTTGLLDRVRSENELAFVLGHELGHFRHRDHLRALGRSAALGLIFAALATGGVPASFPATVSALTERSFDRDQEREADRFGLGLVAAEYGHVGGADGFFQGLPDAHPGVGARLSSWVATHPVSAERIEALHAEAAAHGWATAGAPTPLPPAWAQPPAE